MSLTPANQFTRVAAVDSSLLVDLISDESVPEAVGRSQLLMGCLYEAGRLKAELYISPTPLIDLGVASTAPSLLVASGVKASEADKLKSLAYSALQNLKSLGIRCSTVLPFENGIIAYAAEELWTGEVVKNGRDARLLAEVAYCKLPWLLTSNPRRYTAMEDEMRRILSARDLEPPSVVTPGEFVGKLQRALGDT